MKTNRSGYLRHLLDVLKLAWNCDSALAFLAFPLLPLVAFSHWREDRNQ